jgi:nitroreductase
MLALAQRTASWCNTQPWQVVITTGPSTAQLGERLTEAVIAGDRRSDLPGPEAYLGVYRERRRESGHLLYASVGVRRDDREARLLQALENFRFFGAPHAAVVTTDRQLGSYGAVDCGAYVGNLLLAAQSLGIATVAQAAIATVSDAVREHLGLTEDRQVVCAVSFGYADQTHPANAFRMSRASLDDVVRWA